MEHVGWLNDDCILPVIGNDALDYTGSLGHLHTAAEGELGLQCTSYILL